MNVVVVLTEGNKNKVTKDNLYSLLKIISNSLNPYTEIEIDTEVGRVKHSCRVLDKNNIVIVFYYKDKEYILEMDINEKDYMVNSVSTKKKKVLVADMTITPKYGNSDFPIEKLSLIGNTVDMLSLLDIDTATSKEIMISDDGIRNELVDINLDNVIYKYNAIPFMYYNCNNTTINDKDISSDEKYVKLMEIIESNAKDMNLSINEFMYRFSNYFENEYNKSTIYKEYKIIKTDGITREFTKTDLERSLVELILVTDILYSDTNMTEGVVVNSDKDKGIIEVNYKDDNRDNTITVVMNDKEIIIQDSSVEIDIVGTNNTTTIREFIIPRVETLLKKHGYDFYLEKIDDYLNKQ